MDSARNTYTYISGTSTNQVIHATGGGKLWAVICGDATSVVTIGDHPTTATTNVVVKLNAIGGLTPIGGYKFENGITVTVATAGDVTVITGP